jgi:hypothetical protein
MNQADNDASDGYYLALWSRREPERLVIVNNAGKVVSSCSVAQDCDRPGWGMLLAAGWCAYPGSEWEEERPGRWEVAVFQESRLGEARGG